MRALGVEEGTGFGGWRDKRTSRGEQVIESKCMAQWTLKPTSGVIELSLVEKCLYRHF